MNIEEAKERLKLCSTNQCNICGRYEKEECMLERNRCEKTVLSELEKKEAVINEIEDLCIRKSDDEGEEYGGVIIWNFAHKIMEIINKVEREGK